MIIAQQSLAEISLWDSEESSIHVVPNYEWTN